LARYQALAGGELHLLPTSPDSLRRTTLLGRKDKEALAALLARLLTRLAARCQVRTGIKVTGVAPAAGLLRALASGDVNEVVVRLAPQVVCLTDSGPGRRAARRRCRSLG